MGSIRPAEADDSEALRKRIIIMLSGHDKLPPPDAWRKLGPRGNSMLVDIYHDPTVRPVVRGRALAVLAYYASQQSYAVLREAAFNVSNRTVFRRIAIKALGYGFADRAQLDLGSLLDDKDVHIREAAVYGFGFIKTPHVKRLLEAKLSVEESLTVRQAIEKVLKDFPK
jgi:hypothetical protein